MKRITPLVVFCALAALGSVAAGCGDSGGPDPKIEQVRVDKAVHMRELFNKAGGDYSKLEAADKADFDKLAGGEGAAQKAFAEMKAGPGGPASSGPAGGPPAGPG